MSLPLVAVLTLLLLAGSIAGVRGGLWEDDGGRSAGPASASAGGGPSPSGSHRPSAGRSPASLRFERLGEAELAAHYSGAPVAAVTDGHSAVPTVQSQLAQLAAPLHSTSLVNVVLVGFAKDGDAAVGIEGLELARYLQAAGLGRDQAHTTVAALDEHTLHAGDSAARTLAHRSLCHCSSAPLSLPHLAVTQLTVPFRRLAFARQRMGGSQSDRSFRHHRQLTEPAPQPPLWQPNG
jgi:hypothetical protein